MNTNKCGISVHKKKYVPKRCVNILFIIDQLKSILNIILLSFVSSFPSLKSVWKCEC